MATRKEPIDIEYDEPLQEATLGAAESNGPLRIARPADWGAAHDRADLPPFSSPGPSCWPPPMSTLPRASPSRGSVFTTPRMACSSRNPSVSYVKKRHGDDLFCLFSPSPKRPGRAAQPDPQFLRGAAARGAGRWAPPPPPKDGSGADASAHCQFLFLPTRFPVNFPRKVAWRASRRKRKNQLKQTEPSPSRTAPVTCLSLRPGHFQPGEKRCGGWRQLHDQPWRDPPKHRPGAGSP